MEHHVLDCRYARRNVNAAHILDAICLFEDRARYIQIDISCVPFFFSNPKRCFEYLPCFIIQMLKLIKQKQKDKTTITLLFTSTFSQLIILMFNDAPLVNQKNGAKKRLS